MEVIKNKALDVLIVGAGPAGLMMACQLALHNISFRIIDKKTSPLIHSGALIIHARTLELFQQLNLAENALKAGTIANSINLCFNHRKNYLLDISNFGKRQTEFPYILLIEQWKTENLLAQFIAEKGYSVEYGTSLTEFIRKGDRVISKINHPDGSTEKINSGFLIGADGNESFVRAKLNIPFPGKTQQSKLFITDCETSLSTLQRGIYFYFASDITSGFFPLKEKQWRIDGIIPQLDNNTVNFEVVAKSMGNKIDKRLVLNHPTWFSIFRSHSKCADSFRMNQCFLIGDAAHVHSPVGAQGMNTGIQDACNLAWKLAFFIQGKASDNLLDTYQLERRPLALNIIRYTDLAYSFITSDTFIKKFLRLQLFPLMLPTLFLLFRKNQKVSDRLFILISGLGIEYKDSPLSSPDRDNFSSRSPKPGERFPFLNDEKDGKHSNFNKALALTNFSLLVFGRNNLPPLFQSILSKYKNAVRVKYINYEVDSPVYFEKLGIKKEGCYLVRPDLYIGWRSHDFDAKSLNEYLQKTLK